jgi:alpha-L-fucosidase 2
MTGCIPELLLQSHTDVIRVLPAVPADWPDGSFHGLRARGGLTFDVSWRDGVLTTASVRAAQSGTYRIALPDGERTVELEAGQLVDLVRTA